MAAFYDRYAGCFDGDCLLRMSDGSEKRARDVRKGDLVRTESGSGIEVQCVVRTRCPNSMARLARFDSGLRITPYHPVWHEGSWAFPCEFTEVKEMPCESTCTIILASEEHNAVIVEGICCIALGHGVKDGSASHPFFGNREEVLKAFSSHAGFESGIVDLEPSSWRRDPVTGLVNGIQ
eukprot:TRINITY_DN5999_c2_g1_i1.p1 TRINITY_DN5999_c2_g1~~TRINITY_DN5999_c2_g1_i1.p1  ORF type:complete len:199 (+),score=21.74 TRINITY_DN5999_c2_g1_i1:63-599(+)